MATDQRVIWQDLAVIKAVQGTLEQRMAAAAIVVRDQVKVLSNRGNADGKNPSLPGEPPKKVSGRFFKSVTSQVVRDTDGSVLGLIGTDVPYQPRLELGFVGTDSKGRVYHQAPRPAFRPALEMSRQRIRQILGVV